MGHAWAALVGAISIMTSGCVGGSGSASEPSGRFSMDPNAVAGDPRV